MHIKFKSFIEALGFTGLVGLAGVIGLFGLVIVAFTAMPYEEIERVKEQVVVADGFQLIDSYQSRADCYHDGRVSCLTTDYIYQANDPIGSTREVFINRSSPEVLEGVVCGKSGEGFFVDESSLENYWRKDAYANISDQDSLRLVSIFSC